MPPAASVVTSPAPYLLSPFRLGPLQLKNRVVLAPLTRGRAGPTRVPNDLMATYYAQRAGAGLIISEATAVSEQGYGWLHAPGIYTEEHVQGWKGVTKAVHDKGGAIFLQLWHMGRQSHSSFGQQPVSASALPVGAGQVYGADGNKYDYEVPRPLGLEELPGVVEQYRRASALAKAADFDGVEIHGANGYLLDQFLQSASNKRTDAYGGPKEQRFRLMREVVEAVVDVWGPEGVGLRLSPNGAFGGMGSEDNWETFSYVASELKRYNLAYLHVMDGLGFGFHGKDRAVTLFDVKSRFGGTVMGNVGFTRDTADGAIRTGTADLVAFGRPYISNPDLAERFAADVPLTPSPPPERWYRGGEHDYVDWPAHEEDKSRL